MQDDELQVGPKLTEVEAGKDLNPSSVWPQSALVERTMVEPMDKIEVSIVVPTYNERENAPILCQELREELDGRWTYEVIFVDDNSSDGTGNVVRQLAHGEPKIRLLERPKKLGLASAVLEGFRMAQGDYWVMMDGDLSHRPQDLPALLKVLKDADIVVGSRYISGGGVKNWPLHRNLVSRVASAVSRILVGLEVRDPTSGFGAFRKVSASNAPNQVLQAGPAVPTAHLNTASMNCTEE